MKKLELSQEVVIEYYDLFGGRAYIEFSPGKKSGWYWKTKYGLIPINHVVALLKQNQIALKFGDSYLNIIEHITAMMYTGLCDVVIECSSWPPYHGRPKEMWDKIKPCLKRTDEDIVWKIPNSPVKFEYGNGRFVNLEPNNKGRLKVTIEIDFPKFGKSKETFIVSEEDSILEECFEAHALVANSTSSLLQKISKYANNKTLFGNIAWRHHDDVLWPNDFSKEELLQKIIRHRLIDLLGMLALSGFISADVYSYKGGHEGDLNLIDMLNFSR